MCVGDGGYGPGRLRVGILLANLDGAFYPNDLAGRADIQNDGFGNGFHMARITRGLPQVKRVNQVVFVRAQKLLLEQWSQDIPAGFSMCNKI